MIRRSGSIYKEIYRSRNVVRYSYILPGSMDPKNSIPEVKDSVMTGGELLNEGVEFIAHFGIVEPCSDKKLRLESLRILLVTKRSTLILDVLSWPTGSCDSALRRVSDVR